MRSLQSQVGTAWISKTALTFMVKEFIRNVPNETGGVLMGYWLAGSEGAVITQVVGPGPNAKHREFGFVPDASYQESEIARIYEESARLHTYLGDWHTHPDSTTRLSRTDRCTLIKIARHVDARVPDPLMAIVGESDPLKLQIWQYRPASVRGFKSSSIVPLKITEFA